MNNMPIQHKIIAASAGSGKTFRLVSRLLRLLATTDAGQPLTTPERIVALTFSRAAAGEIFDSLVLRLANAAADEHGAAEEARSNVDMPRLTQTDFRRLLRAVISSMHLSPIGTLDSFFVRILKSFPLEFGIAGNFTILGDHELAVQKDSVFRELLRSGQGATSRAEQRSFLESFKLATFGTEVKSVRELLDQFTSDAHELYLRAPSAALWGNQSAIWPDGCEWLDGPEVDTAAAAGALLHRLDTADVPPDQRTPWADFIELATAMSPQAAAPLPNSKSHLFWKLLDVTDELKHGTAELTVNRRKVTLDAELCRAAYELLRHIVRCCLAHKLAMTQGLCDIMQSYEAEYATRLRSTGKMTFSDITVLLGNTLDQQQGRVLTRSLIPNADRLYIDYRLDGAFDHWALDEFQDTSRTQWSVVSNLVDEAIQDSAGTRSFFAVGDVKQAIYGWRGGDSRLMQELLDRYNGSGIPVIDTETLAQSWRSCEAVLNAVNGVFDHLAEADDLPVEVVERWRDPTVWQPHQAAKTFDGYAALFELPYEKGASANDVLQKKLGLLAELLQQIKPWQNRLSVAILVRSNTTGANVAEGLREHGVPAAWDGDTAIADNPVVAALLALLRFAEHPGDSFAWQHVLMTPLRRCLPAPGQTQKQDTSLSVLHSVHERGFEHTFAVWIERLRAHERMDPFSLRRCSDLLAAAREFDATASRSCLDFVGFVESYTVRDMPSEHAVRVMTMHRSKGLGFDIVVLPDLESGGLTTIGQQGVSIARGDGPGARPQWVLSMPRKDIVRADPVLQQHLQRCEHEACFEELCLLYVAMTRAKQGLYMITAGRGPSSKTLYPATLITRLLADGARSPLPWSASGALLLYRSGSPTWFHAAPVAEQPEADASSWYELPEAASQHPRRSHVRRLPSQAEDSARQASSLFSLSSKRRRELGSLVHALFEQLQWLDSEPLPAVLARWRDHVHPRAELAADAETLFTRAMAADEVRAVFTRPSDSAPKLWREKSFEILHDEAWVSGTFDRVHLSTDSDGRYCSASLFDFKTDRVETEPELADAIARYTPQITQYRLVLERLLGLSRDHVRAALVFTHCRRCIECGG